MGYSASQPKHCAREGIPLKEGLRQFKHCIGDATALSAREGIPLKEGLRLSPVGLYIPVTLAREGIPLKEGLRLSVKPINENVHYRPRGYSIKRRIKTKNPLL